MDKDEIKKPDHYSFLLPTGHRLEAVDLLELLYRDNAIMYNVLKYILRAQYKGKYLHDLKKAHRYLGREIAKCEGDLFSWGDDDG